MAATAARASGQRLQEVREHLHVSQQLLAQLVGVSKGTIQNYESGRVGLVVQRIEDIAYALHIDVGFLINPPGAPLPKSRGNHPRMLRSLQPDWDVQSEIGMLLGPIGYYSRAADRSGPVDVDRIGLLALGASEAHGQLAWADWNKRIARDDRGRVQQQLQRLDREGVFAAQYQLIGLDGAPRVILDTARMACNAAGRPVRLNGSLVDITHLQRTASLDRAVARWLKSFKL